MAGYDFNADLTQAHAEREQRFGEKPFTFGYIPHEADENGNTPSGPGTPAQFFVRANPGYLGIKRIVLLSEGTSGGETFEAVEAYIYSMIDPRDGGHERFKAVLSNPDFPISFDDLIKLEGWLLNVQTDVPPTGPEPSSGSSTVNGQSSTAPSSIAPEGASTTST